MSGVVASEALVAALLATGVALLVALVGTATLAIGYSVRGWRADRRRAAATEPVREGLFARLWDDDPDWEEWVSGLGSVERRVLEAQVEEYLRLLTGSDRERLTDLARALGFDRRAERWLTSRDPIERLRALSWLSLLDQPVDPDELLAACGDDRDERAATARLFAERSVPEAATIGTRVLLEPEKALSLFGLDTLYVLNRSDPTALLAACAERSTGWSDALLVQALDAIEHCVPATRNVPVAWLVSCLSHESPAVRAAAVRAVGTYAWRADVRSRIDIEWLVADPEPEVRRAVYRYLAEYGDEGTIRTVVGAAAAEPNGRALLIVAEELTDRLLAADDTLSPVVRRNVAWVSAERAAGT